MTVAEYMKIVRQENKMLVNRLRKACLKADRDPQERYHQTQAGTLRWAIAIIERLGLSLTDDQLKPV